MRRLGSALLFLIGITLSFITNLVTAKLDWWYSANSQAILLVGLALLILGVVLEFRATAAEAHKAGQEFSFGSLLGSLLADAILWGAIGLSIGAMVDSYFSSWLAAKNLHPTVVAFLQQLGQVRLAMIVVGLFVGTRLRFLYAEKSDDLAFIGMIGGGASAFPAALYVANWQPQSLPFVLGVAPQAAAALAVFWAASTAVFRVGYDHRKRWVEIEKKRQKREEEDAQKHATERVDRAIGRIAVHGYAVKSKAHSDWLEAAAKWYLSEKHGAERTKELEQRVKNTPFYDLGKKVVDTYTGSSGPYTVIDAHGTEIQTFASVAALEAFADSLDRTRLIGHE